MSKESKTKSDRTARALEALTEQLTETKARLDRLETRATEIDHRAEVVAAAQRAWRPVMVARALLVLMSDAGDRGTVAVAVVRALAEGRPLDVDVRDVDGDRVELVDVRGRVVADLPRAALLVLPKIASSPEAGKLLGRKAAAS